MIAAIIRAIGRRILELRIGYYEDVLELVAEQRQRDDEAVAFSVHQLSTLRRRLQCHVQHESNLETRTNIRKIAR